MGRLLFEFKKMLLYNKIHLSSLIRGHVGAVGEVPRESSLLALMLDCDKEVPMQKEVL